MPRSAFSLISRFTVTGWFVCLLGVTLWIWKTPVVTGDTPQKNVRTSPANPRPVGKKKKSSASRAATVKDTRRAGKKKKIGEKDVPVARKGEVPWGEFIRPDTSDEKEEEGKEPNDSPDEAMEDYIRRRLPEGMTELPVERYVAAREQANRMEQYSTVLGRKLPSRNEMKARGESGKTAALAGNWTELGPGNIGGRTRALVINPVNPDIMYAAGVAGGVWKTTDAGGNWTPLTDMLSNLAVCSLAMDPTNPNILYAGTGEGFFNGDGVRGLGIFKTTDGGANWAYLTATSGSDFFYVNDIVISPNNASRVYAATRTGIQRSDDGGANWTKIYNTAVPGGVQDLVIRTDQPTDYMFAAVGNLAQSSIIRRTDVLNPAGFWEVVYSESGIGRVSLALAPSNQNVIYALAASIESGNYNRGLRAVFRSTSSGDISSWTARVRNTDPVKLNTSLLSNPLVLFASECGLGESGFSNQGSYDNCIAVDPVNENIVYCGGIDAFRSDDGGASWGLMSYWWADRTDPHFAHADHHVIVFHPQYNGTTNQIFFHGTDGGVFRSDNARAATATGNTAACDPNNTSVSWTSLNHGYGVTQFYHGTVYPGGQTYFGGTQDNGTARGTDAAGVNNWERIFGGDGTYGAVDPTNVNSIYTGTQRGRLRRSGNGTDFLLSISGLTGTFQFVTPIAIDPGNPRRFWTSSDRMWRSDNGQRFWRAASASFLPVGGATAIAISQLNPNLVIAGSSLGIFRTNRALTATDTTVWAGSSPRSGNVSWLAYDPNDSNIVYATYSTFGGTHVWKSIDGGATWAGLDGAPGSNIPDISVHCVVVDPTNSQRLFVGTDIGVFTSDNGGANWMVENSGFANTVTETLIIEGTNLFAFTHGRGAFRAPIQPTANSRPVVTAHPQSVLLNSGATATLSVTATGNNLSYQWFQGEAPDTSFPVVGATGSSFTTPALATRARYWARVTNANGFASSTTATVNAEPSPSPVGGLGILTGTPSIRTDAGLASGGADASFVQGGIIGVTTGGTTTVAEDFTVPAGGWNPASVTFYGYQEGTFATPPVSTLTGVTTLRLYNGVPGAGGTVIGAVSSPNVLSNGWSGNYRTETDPAETQRPIMAVTVQWPFGQLAAGNYWIEWGLSGSLSSGPFVPSSPTPAAAPARQFNGTTWADITDGATSATLPFVINGTTGTQCGIGLTSAAASFGVAGGSGSTAVVVPAGCAWTASSNVPWITLNGTVTGTASGTLAYTVAQNRGIARTGTITVSGQTFTVTQAAPTFRASTPGQFRPSNGFVYLRNTNDTGFADREFFYGTANDIPVAGDWNGDGVDTIGIYRNGTFFLRNSNTSGFADLQFPFGAPGDIPIVGDWDGDGVDTVGVVRGNTVFLRNSNSAGNADIQFNYGLSTDTFIVGDWDGDGIDTIGCYRRTNGFVYIRNLNTTGIADFEFFYGLASDRPVVGDWNGDGIDTIGIVRGNQWFLRNSNTSGFADIQYFYGNDTDTPIAGDWDGNP